MLELLVGEEGARELVGALLRRGPEGIERALGMRISRDGRIWELTGYNDLNVPYWSEVGKGGRVGRKQYTITDSEREVEARLRPPTIQRPEGAAPEKGC